MKTTIPSSNFYSCALSTTSISTSSTSTTVPAASNNQHDSKSDGVRACIVAPTYMQRDLSAYNNNHRKRVRPNSNDASSSPKIDPKRRRLSPAINRNGCDPASILIPASKTLIKCRSQSPLKSASKANGKNAAAGKRKTNSQSAKNHGKQTKQTRKSTTKNGRNSNSHNRNSVDDWSETDDEDELLSGMDDDYKPPRSRARRLTPSAKPDLPVHQHHNSDDDDGNADVSIATRTRRGNSTRPAKSASSCSALFTCDESSDNHNGKPSGYRELNWRKNDVATPKFIVLDGTLPSSLSSTPTKLPKTKSASPSPLSFKPPRLSVSASTMEMHGVVGEREDTSNEAYFYRHYRAEAREKLFYEQLFESRMKQQQILEAKEKRKRNTTQKKKPRKRRTNKIDAATDNHEDGDAEEEQEEQKEKEKESEADVAEQTDRVDLSLPQIPKGPWTYKLGPEYDKKPIVPSMVSNQPQLNYAVAAPQEQTRTGSWRMPPQLIRRVDYGQFSHTDLATKTARRGHKRNGGNNSKHGHHVEQDNEEEQKKKQELLELYKLMKKAKHQQQAAGPVDARCFIAGHNHSHGQKQKEKRKHKSRKK